MKNISAQVILKPAVLQDAFSVVDMFRRAGFIAGPLVANNFSITAPAPLFEKYFGAASEQASSARQQSELPLDGLPPETRNAVEAVVFTKPPDFGPGGNY